MKSGSGVHDFYGWDHATDAEFVGHLTYNDETHKYYTYYGTVRNDETVVVGLTFDANIVPIVEFLPYKGAFVREPLSGFWQNVGYYTGIGGYDTYPGIVSEWKVSREGRLIGIELIELVAPDIGIGKGGLLKAAKGASKGLPHGDAGRTLNKAKKQIQELEKQLESATGSTRVKIRNKIEKIKKNAQKKAKGETHWRK